jgi:hypothetical protein
MIKQITLLFFLTIVFGCKKYQNDEWFSAYTVEERLTIGLEKDGTDNNGSNWECDKMEYSVNSKWILSPKIAKLSLTDSKESTIFHENIAIDNFKSTWKLADKKSNLIIEGVDKFKILKLTMKKMELKSTDGTIFYFTRHPA